jgi:hypothetical protein
MSFSFIIWILIMVAFTIFVIAANWLIYEKAGKPGWASIIPVYSTLILLEIVGKPWWWLLLMFIPVANLVFAIWMTNLLSKSFGYNEGFTVGLILLPFIFYPIMGFSSVKYKGPAGTEGQAMLM